DFAYEVSRSLAACEGAILLVDASQGVEAQTLANAYHAIEANLEIVVAFNKVDLPSADIERARQQVEEVIGLDASEAVLVSAKTGLGIDDVLEAIVKKVPPPMGDAGAPLKALLVDSWYDTYLGVMILVRVRDGVLRKGMKVRMMAAGTSHVIERVGIFTPKPQTVDELGPGELGFITAAIKEVAQTHVGDTLTDERQPAAEPLSGFKPSVPVVFCGLYPVEADDFTTLRESLAKLRLNDASFQFETESSPALGFGFRCGFLGLLHLEIIQERLSREFDLDLIATAPSVIYRAHQSDGMVQEIHNPVDWPEETRLAKVEEPWIKATIMVPDEHLGAVLKLCEERRGVQQNLTYIGQRAVAVYRLPLNEVVFDFYDRLKSVSRGYASFDYQLDGYEEGELVKMSILVNGDPVDALSMIVNRARAESRGRAICERLKELIPRQMFKIAIQAAIGSRVIARETVGALRKDVLAKCYGGDVTRKRKLLEKQKRGKKRMREFGKVEIPQEAFIAALKLGDE
ncbi:MAG: elongation factor 4, partial [Alphaproteobacteria bacterium]|nr:elongation factor 4 [Alphaproteobacteria bacterium]